MNTLLIYSIIMFIILDIVLLFNYRKIIIQEEKIRQLEKNTEFLIQKLNEEIRLQALKKINSKA